MNFGLEGRTAVVTGGSSGIGLATAKVFLSAGARVAICARDASRLEAAHSLLTQNVGAERVFAQRCDVLGFGEAAKFAVFAGEVPQAKRLNFD